MSPHEDFSNPDSVNNQELERQRVREICFFHYKYDEFPRTQEYDEQVEEIGARLWDPEAVEKLRAVSDGKDFKIEWYLGGHDSRLQADKDFVDNAIENQNPDLFLLESGNQLKVVNDIVREIFVDYPDITPEIYVTEIKSRVGAAFADNPARANTWIAKLTDTENHFSAATLLSAVENKTMPQLFDVGAKDFPGDTDQEKSAAFLEYAKKMNNVHPQLVLNEITKMADIGGMRQWYRKCLLEYFALQRRREEVVLENLPNLLHEVYSLEGYERSGKEFEKVGIFFGSAHFRLPHLLDAAIAHNKLDITTNISRPSVNQDSYTAGYYAITKHAFKSPDLNFEISDTMIDITFLSVAMDQAIIDALQGQDARFLEVATEKYGDLGTDMNKDRMIYDVLQHMFDNQSGDHVADPNIAFTFAQQGNLSEMYEYLRSKMLLSLENI